jgi:hypothetical protein
MTRTSTAFAVAGALWFADGVVMLSDPAYYHPVTAIDYAAVGLYSLALGATAVALFFFEHWAAVRVHRAARAALLVGTIGGITASLANFGEDWLGLPLGLVYVAGVILFYLGMVAAGLVLVARGRELRWIGALLIVPFPAPLLGQAAGFMIGGAAFIACAALLVRVRSNDPRYPKVQ